MSITLKQANHICEVVRKVMENGYTADKTINFEFRDNQIILDSDRTIIADFSYELIRWWRLLLEINNNYPATQKVDYYQLLATWLILNNWELPDSAKFRAISKNLVKEQYNNFLKIRKIKNSIPDWLDQAGYMAYAHEWESEIDALNAVPPMFLRTNRLKIKPAELLQKLIAEGFTASSVDSAPEAIKLGGKSNIFSSKLYKEGYFEIQDAGSQQIASFLDARPGMRVADACAGNGGKTLHLASIMQNKGKIVAMDVKEERLKALKTRLTRSGSDIVETKLIESTKAIKRLEASFDRVLLDVPCSGTGALRRNPEIKWNMNLEKLKNLNKTQSYILDNYSKLLKKDGLMVYATCSILPSENQDQVKAFFDKRNGEFELVKEQVISPAKTGFDGFYMAQFLKK